MVVHAHSPLLLSLMAVAVLPLAVLLAACGSANRATSGSPPAAQTSATAATVAATPSRAAQTSTTDVTIHATDFAFQLGKTSIPAGPVHFVLINDSPYFPHEVMVYPQGQPKLQDLLAALAAGQDVNHDDYLQGVVGSAEDVQPGQTASFDATLQPGTYELGCFITSTIGPGQMMGQYPGNGGINGYPMGPGMMGGYSGSVGAGGYAVGMRVNHYAKGMHTLLTVTAP